MSQARNSEEVAAAGFRWRVDEVYDRDEVIAFWKISPATLADWQRDGLPVLARGMRRYFYLGKDVVEFVRLNSVAPESHRCRGAAKRAKNTGKN